MLIQILKKPPRSSSWGTYKLDLEHIGLEVIEDFQLVDRSPAPVQMDMLSYLHSKQARRRAPLEDPDTLAGELPEDDLEDISDLAEFFLEIAQGSEEKTQYLYNNLSDPRRLAETLTYLARMHPAPETGIQISVDLVHQTFGHIADTIKNFPTETRENIVRNIAEAILTTDKSVRTQVINSGLAADVGKTPFVADICAVHILLRLMGHASGGWRGSLRAGGYSSAPAVLGFVPYAGAMMGGLWIMVLQFVALKRVHRAPTGILLLAYLLPVVAVLILAAAAMVIAISLISPDLLALPEFL